MQSKVSGHWTDDQLVAHLYGVGPGNEHLEECDVCRNRLAAMRGQRQTLEEAWPSGWDAGAEFLAAQRRRIYIRIAQPSHWWAGNQLRRWVSAAATLLVLGGGLVLYEEHRGQTVVNDQISDAQLAEQVSSMAQDAEPQPTAPLEALFQE